MFFFKKYFYLFACLFTYVCMCICMYVYNLYTQHGTQIQDPEIKSYRLFQLSQPGTQNLCVVVGGVLFFVFLCGELHIVFVILPFLF